MADPGEFGLESYYCRLICVVIFMIAGISEIIACVDMARLLWWVPTFNEPWVEHRREVEVPLVVQFEGMLTDRSALSTDRSDRSWIDVLTDPFSTGQDEDDQKYTSEECLDHVRVKVAGMSSSWKLINVSLILIPKCCLVFLTASEGIVFMMETAGIENAIINSLALFFLMEIDNIIMGALMSNSANKLLDMCEGLPIATEEQKEARFRSAADTFEEFTAAKHVIDFWKGMAYEVVCVQLWKFFTVFLIVAWFVSVYYFNYCNYVNGQFVSKDEFMPITMDYNFFNALFGDWYPIEQEPIPYWTMPEPSDW
jgi:hypothetical protein